MQSPPMRPRLWMGMLLIAGVAIIPAFAGGLSSDVTFNAWLLAWFALPSLLPLLFAWFTRARAVAFSTASLGSAAMTALYTYVKFNSPLSSSGSFAGMAVFVIPLYSFIVAIYTCVMGTALINIRREVASWSLGTPTFAISLALLLAGVCLAALYGEAFVRLP